MNYAKMPQGIRQSYRIDDINYFAQEILKNPSETNIKRVLRMSMDQAVIESQDVVMETVTCWPVSLLDRARMTFRPHHAVEELIASVKRNIHSRLEGVKNVWQ